jgi:hypothetical protein
MKWRSTILHRLTAGLNSVHRAADHDLMRTFACQKHNELIDKCTTLARDVGTAIELAKDRLTEEDERDADGLNHDQIVNK